ncbi:complement factor H isoform X1 [Coregonus clupeaformis]|uniref:complement factor H isoform X1 n=1 Tax=Coregonus clupeaformis TaxID=59861 RepID=UPI001BDFF068|nr:complement factor H isoform X1 [Coregonus clupeaformis]
MRLITLSFVLALWFCTLTFVKGQDCLRNEFIKNPDHAKLDVSKLEDTASGETVRLPCAIGYVGFFRFKCNKGDWKKEGGRKCEPKSCGHPGDTPNGDFHLSILDDFVFGAEVVYDCRKGYQMVTRTRHRTCVEQGWDSALPICEAVKCPVIQVNDNVVVIGSSEDATYGNVIQFECQSNNMVLKGPSEMDCNDRGEWSSTVPTCEVIKCYAPEIANGAVTGPPKEDYNEDDILRYSCNPRYMKSQGRAPRCTKMVNRAIWSPTPECEEVKCSLSLTPTRGTSYTPAGRNLFLPDERVTVTCASGFWIFTKTSEQTVTCKEDGKWSSFTDCEPITCDDPRDPLVSSPYRWQRGQLRNIQRYSCETGFKTTNARGVATCTSDGSWTPHPLCEEITCDKPDIPNAVIEDPKTRYKYNEQLTYECKRNYELLDSTTRPAATCTTNGWTRTLGCKEIEGACINPTVENGFIQSNESNVDPRNSIIYYSCNERFKPSTRGWWGAATCTEGKWSGISKCIDKSKCGRIPVIPNTIKVTHQEVYNNQETVQINCKDGYSSENMKMQCENGEWQGLLPDCKPQGVPCDPPPKVENAIVKIPYQNKYIEGFEVNYECRKSFEKEGLQKITCENGNWTPPPPTCKQYCGEPEGAGKHFQIIDQELERYENGNQIEYECLSPYKGPGGKTICKNGEWHKPVECKASCLDPPHIYNGDYTKENKDAEGVFKDVSYRCNLHYTLSFKGSIRCLNGVWEAPPQCFRPCEIHTFDPKHNLQDLSKISYVPHKDQIAIKCKNGYYHEWGLINNKKEIKLECSDGKITYLDHPPICSNQG